MVRGRLWPNLTIPCMHAITRPNSCTHSKRGQKHFYGACSLKQHLHRKFFHTVAGSGTQSFKDSQHASISSPKSLLRSKAQPSPCP